MTPADPSLLAQLRQLPTPIVTDRVDERRRIEHLRCEWCRQRWSRKSKRMSADEAVMADHPANACLWYIAHAAILEVQPPETAQTPPACHVCPRPATREFCYAAEPWTPYCPSHPAQYVTAGDRPLRRPAPTPDPPAETPTPNGTDDWIALARTAATRALDTFTPSLPADTPTGLAPLILDGMTDAVLAEYVDFAREFDTPITATAIILNLTWELDAQRQASASVRREATIASIQSCIKTLNELAPTDAPLRRTMRSRLNDLLSEALGPRVSPRPPSGGGQ